SDHGIAHRDQARRRRCHPHLLRQARRPPAARPLTRQRGGLGCPVLRTLPSPTLAAAFRSYCRGITGPCRPPCGRINRQTPEDMMRDPDNEPELAQDTIQSTPADVGRNENDAPASPVEPVLSLDSPELYIHRELSQLQFNIRVLEQALDESYPLLERLKFLLIFSSNLDEFFEIRVAGLKEQIAFAREQTGPDGLQPHQVLAKISEIAHQQVARQYS